MAPVFHLHRRAGVSGSCFGLAIAGIWENEPEDGRPPLFLCFSAFQTKQK